MEEATDIGQWAAPQRPLQPLRTSGHMALKGFDFYICQDLASLSQSYYTPEPSKDEALKYQG